MKRITHNRIAVIEAPTAPLFEAAINAALDDLADKSPELIIESVATHTAYIRYKYDEIIAETISDRFAMMNIHYYCRDCAYCELAKKKDGTTNRTIKKAWCEHGQKRTYKDAPACETFFFELVGRSGQFKEGGAELPAGALMAIKQIAPDHHDER